MSLATYDYRAYPRITSQYLPNEKQLHGYDYPTVNYHIRTPGKYVEKRMTRLYGVDQNYFDASKLQSLAFQDHNVQSATFRNAYIINADQQMKQAIQAQYNTPLGVGPRIIDTDQGDNNMPGYIDGITGNANGPAGTPPAADPGTTGAPVPQMSGPTLMPGSRDMPTTSEPKPGYNAPPTPAAMGNQSSAGNVAMQNHVNPATIGGGGNPAGEADNGGDIVVTNATADPGQLDNAAQPSNIVAIYASRISGNYGGVVRSAVSGAPQPKGKEKVNSVADLAQKSKQEYSAIDWAQSEKEYSSANQNDAAIAVRPGAKRVPNNHLRVDTTRVDTTMDISERNVNSGTYWMSTSGSSEDINNSENASSGVRYDGDYLYRKPFHTAATPEGGRKHKEPNYVSAMAPLPPSASGPTESFRAPYEPRNGLKPRLHKKKKKKKKAKPTTVEELGNGRFPTNTGHKKKQFHEPVREPVHHARAPPSTPTVQSPTPQRSSMSTVQTPAPPNTRNRSTSFESYLPKKHKKMSKSQKLKRRSSESNANPSQPAPRISTRHKTKTRK